MNTSDANPFLVVLFFIARCLIPLFLMLGVTYILRRLGLIQPPPPPPKNWDGDNDQGSLTSNGQGDLAHGKI